MDGFDSLANQILEVSGGGAATRDPEPQQTPTPPPAPAPVPKPAGPFGFSDPQQALSGDAVGFPGLPVIGETGSQCMMTPSQRDMLNNKQICCIVMTRVAKWFSEHGCPVVITPRDGTRPLGAMQSSSQGTCQR